MLASEARREVEDRCRAGVLEDVDGGNEETEEKYGGYDDEGDDEARNVRL